MSRDIKIANEDDWETIDQNDTVEPQPEDLKALRDAGTRMSIELDNLRAEVTVLTARLSNKQKEAELLIERNMGSEANVRALTDRIAALQQELGQLRLNSTRQATNITEAEQNVQEMQEAILKLTTEVTRLQAQNENATRERDHLNTVIANTRTEINEKDRRIAELVSDRANFQAEAVTNNNRASQMRNEVTRLQGLLARKTAECEALEARSAAAARDAVNTSTRDVERFSVALRTVATALNVPVVDGNFEGAALGNYVNSLTAAIENLKNDLRNSAREREQMASLLEDALNSNKTPPSGFASARATTSRISGPPDTAAGSTGSRKISYQSFASGDLGLFFPTTNGLYVAFNDGAPNYYLSQESMDAFQLATSRRAYVLVEILEIEDVKETKTNNQYGVAVGGVRHMVTGISVN